MMLKEDLNLVGIVRERRNLAGKNLSPSETSTTAVVDPCMTEEREPEEKCEAQPPTSHHLAFVSPKNSFLVAGKHHSHRKIVVAVIDYVTPLPPLGIGCRSCCRL
ncbi:hypothetical protein PIB30_100599, partial [Stylosanthes scabra]|nr:hypothetical protein [Stylosanthes scabra]